MEEKVTKARIHGYFPVPMMETTIDRHFTKEELETINRLIEDPRMNVGNFITENHQVLELEELLDIRHSCVNILTNFVMQIYQPKHKIIPYITQSWISLTYPGQHHHRHNHPNSFLSGVIYIDVDEERDSIRFHRDDYQQIKIVSEQTNPFTAMSMQLPVSNGKIVVFPSSLSHSVETIEGDKPRISIAFNSFLKGQIGDEVYSMGLTL